MAKRYKTRYRPEGVLTKLEAGNELNLSVSTVVSLVKEGKLISTKPEGSNKTYITAVSVEAYKAIRIAQLKAAIAKTQAAQAAEAV